MLSGGVVCHWYFNPDIPEAEMYSTRYMVFLTTTVILVTTALK
jgi:hypothetical protein